MLTDSLSCKWFGQSWPSAVTVTWDSEPLIDVVNCRLEVETRTRTTKTGTDRTDWTGSQYMMLLWLLDHRLQVLHVDVLVADAIYAYKTGELQPEPEVTFYLFRFNSYFMWIFYYSFNWLFF